MRYRFIGKDSLGYKNGKVYDLVINGTEVVGYENAEIVIFRNSWSWKFFGLMTGLCPYSTWKSFSKNWERVNGGTKNG